MDIVSPARRSERGADGQIVFPFDAIHVDVMLHAA
jgi:hypothetical protein